MAGVISDTFIRALPDLTLVVARDGAILSRIGGRELKQGSERAARTLAEMWSPDVAQHLCQLARRSLKGRTPLDQQYRHEHRLYEVRLRPQGIDRVLMVFRDLSASARPGAVGATDESSCSRLIDSRSQLLRWLSLAASEALLRERPLAVITVYLGGLPEVERAFSATVAEELMTAAAKRLHALLRQELPATIEAGPGASECVAPIADQVLAVVIERAPARETLRAIAQRTREALAQPFDLLGRSFRLTPAFGIAFAPEDGVEARALLDHARSAMFEAHHAGRGIAFHSDTLRLRTLSRLDSEQELRWALEHGQLQLDYQPLVTVADRRIVAIQTQPRWSHPVCGLVPADEFLALAETSELARDLGRWVLQRACEDLASARACKGLRAIVCLGRRHLLSEKLLEDVIQTIETTKLNPRRLALKITERVLTAPGELLPRLQDLRESGVQVIVERFGAGYLALSRIASLPVDGVSLDPVFVRDLEHEEHARTVCRSMIDLAHAFGLTAAAEDVNTTGQLAVLAEYKCDLASGHFFGAPQELGRLLAA